MIERMTVARAALKPSWTFVAALVLIVALLAVLNVWQWRRAITAPLRAENAALTEALTRSNRIAKQRERDDTELLRQLSEIAERGRGVRIEYRTAANAQPLPPQCAPGQQRVDAINRALGAPIGDKP